MTPPRPAFDRDRVICDLFASPDVASAIGRMQPDHLRDEMRQEVFVIVCSLDVEKLQGLHERGELKLFMFGALWRMVKSDRSSFYNLHRRYREEMLKTGTHVGGDGSIVRDTRADAYTDELVPGKGAGLLCGKSLAADEPDEQPTTWLDLARYPAMRKRVNKELWRMDPYEADLFRLYLEMGESCAPIAKATGIPERSIRFAVRKAREKLQKALTT